MVSDALFTSRSVFWGTPPELFAKLDAIFDFRLDAAASADNALCARYFSTSEDGLVQDWSPYRRIWLNPPYGREISRWMQKAYRESLKGCLVVCLVPARTDTAWWHDWVIGKAQVTFVRGRLKYANRLGKSSGSAPFPSAVVIYPNVEITVNGAFQPLLERKSLFAGSRRRHPAAIATRHRISEPVGKELGEQDCGRAARPRF